MMRNLEIERLCLAAMSCGIARRCVEAMVSCLRRISPEGSDIISQERTDNRVGAGAVQQPTPGLRQDAARFRTDPKIRVRGLRADECWSRPLVPDRIGDLCLTFRVSERGREGRRHRESARADGGGRGQQLYENRLLSSRQTKLCGLTPWHCAAGNGLGCRPN